MKILIVNAQAPFVRGGAEYLAESLERKLVERGHRAEVLRVPFKWYPPEQILSHMLACRLLRLDGNQPPDLVIGLKFPAYAVPWPNKKLWLLHQFRQVYDFWGTPFQDLPDTPGGHRIRDMVLQADQRYLGEVREIYTISRTVAERLERYNQRRADGVLYPPLLHPECLHAGRSDNYLFFPSRLAANKRQELAIEAMRHVRSDCSLVIAGRADTVDHGLSLERLVQAYGLENRVKLLGLISEEEKIRLMANARAVVYVPYDEDYGYVTLEAMHAHKPVLTCRDSGGPTELITDGRNGRVVDPTAEAVAEGFEAVMGDRSAAIGMGEHAHETLADLNITWDFVLEKLVS